MGIETVRFGVGAPDGPHSAVFRMWTGAYDFYLSGDFLGGVMKASIHLAQPTKPSEFRWMNFQSIQARNKTPGPKSNSRKILDWPGHRVAPTATLEFRLRIPAVGLRAMPFVEQESSEIYWIPAPLSGADVEIDFLQGSMDVPPRPNESMGRDSIIVGGDAIGPIAGNVRGWLVAYLVPAYSAEQVEELRVRVLADSAQYTDASKFEDSARILGMGLHDKGESLNLVDIPAVALS